MAGGAATFGDIAQRQLALMEELTVVISWCQKTRMLSRQLRAEVEEILKQSQQGAIGARTIVNLIREV